ncbi:DUF1648 domain-containing protein [Lysinibacillus yapensis]|uniref:DUF1648 domain-containing protein n=1 Tax=Ureibacillus yapensis TaxID=2304605 RepID=A0A396SBI9_9BACL|nr:DUF5808 domain-containing protein [Lysinibacillus yapensis]RHW34759.1 DUF1648 domain-containing protein [Lysinibacillus yapensis]
MALFIFLIVTAFIAVVQIMIPYLAKRTAVFGVTVPDQYINDATLLKYKKLYAVSVGLISFILIGLYVFWALRNNLLDEQIAMVGAILEFALIFISFSFYMYFHAKTKQLKQKNKWMEELKAVKVTDLSVRSQDAMLPWVVFLLPIVSTVGLMVYTLMNYDVLPQQIPTHWGPSGEADAFKEKSYFSAIQLTLILLILQTMFLGIHIATKKSGIKLSATGLQASRNRQLGLRKYSSWFMFFVVLAVTMLMSYLQLTMIHPQLSEGLAKLLIPIVFLIAVLIGTLIFAVKVGRSDKETFEVVGERIRDIDDDQYWKGGLFYFNKNDPSIFVEKRFGVGWTINFANPIGYCIVFLPIILIILISFI